MNSKVKMIVAIAGAVVVSAAGAGGADDHGTGNGDNHLDFAVHRYLLIEPS